MSRAPSPYGIRERIAAITVGIMAFMELKTQYMPEKFQSRQVSPAVRKIFLPFFGRSLLIMFSRASNSGINAMSKSGLVSRKGGQPSHRRRALNKARRELFFTDVLQL